MQDDNYIRVQIQEYLNFVRMIIDKFKWGETQELLGKDLVLPNSKTLGFSVIKDSGFTIIYQSIAEASSDKWPLYIVSGIAQDVPANDALFWTNQKNKTSRFGGVYRCVFDRNHEKAAIIYEAYIWNGLFKVYGDLRDLNMPVDQSIQEIGAMIQIPVSKSLGLENERNELLEKYGGRLIEHNAFVLMAISES